MSKPGIVIKGSFHVFVSYLNTSCMIKLESGKVVPSCLVYILMDVCCHFGYQKVN